MALPLAWLLLAIPSFGQDAVGFEISVVEVSPEAGGVQKDPRAQRYDRLLGKKLRYESLEVLSTEKRKLALEQTGQLGLPTGKKLRLRPLDRGPQGVLVAVDLDATAQGDFRIPRGKPLLLGGQPHRGGQLFVVIEVVD
ncbi:MAG: hypothetical protein QNK05_07855 [Myxococcota bacterium]|nr:hypothetical protein [Myxococcota bacterium]